MISDIPHINTNGNTFSSPPTAPGELHRQRKRNYCWGMVGGTQHFATALRKSNSPGKHMMIKDILCWGIRFQFSRLLFQRLGSVMIFLPRISYKWLATRMGMAPGFRSNLRWQCPLGRKLIYGPEKWEQHVTAETLNRLLLTRTNHTGSDVRIASGEILNPKAHPRQSVEADWWNWEPSFSVKWKLPEHINLLELRSILLGVKFHVSHLGSTSKRVFHLTDSYISLSIASKGRTGSRQVARVLRKLNAFLLAHGITLVLGHVESTRNPTDGASRQVDLCF